MQSKEKLKNTQSLGTGGVCGSLQLMDGRSRSSGKMVPMNESNALNPIELAEYTVANKIVEEPAFAWWVFG